MFDELAVGVRFTFPGEGITKVQSVALAKGAYNSTALITR